LNADPAVNVIVALAANVAEVLLAIVAILPIKEPDEYKFQLQKPVVL